jgi:flavin-dependent dehydrogenase
VLEKSAKFGRRVGEATVEVSAYFLGRVLGLTQHLNESHLVKQGMRFWFANPAVKNLADASEIGGRYQVRLPSYQLDRSVIDEQVLHEAAKAGAMVVRSASVTKVELKRGDQQTVEYRVAGSTRRATSRWAVDASGVGAVVARQEGWWQLNAEHPTTAAWARWRGVKDWDGRELGRKYPEWAAAPYGIRGTATNHVVGHGWWSWWIPLKGGDMSVGVVFDQRLVEFPKEGGNLGQRIKSFLSRHPVACEMLVDAEPIADDVHWRKNLAYRSTKFVDDGLALVGDAAAFIDPLYSPGMDWLSFTVSSAVNLIRSQRAGKPLNIDVMNSTLDLSYDRWFRAVYKDKYYYMGEFDLMRIAFLLDLGLYYLGIVSQPFKRGPQALLEPPFSQPPSRPIFWLMSTYNRRLAQIARRRQTCGELGRANRGGRLLANGFTLSAGDVRTLLKVVARWGWLELTEGWKSWVQPRNLPVDRPVQPPKPALTEAVKARSGI